MEELFFCLFFFAPYFDRDTDWLHPPGCIKSGHWLPPLQPALLALSSQQAAAADPKRQFHKLGWKDFTQINTKHGFSRQGLAIWCNLTLVMFQTNKQGDIPTG